MLYIPMTYTTHGLGLGGALRAIVTSPYLGSDRELAERPILRGVTVKN